MKDANGNCILVFHDVEIMIIGLFVTLVVLLGLVFDLSTTFGKEGSLCRDLINGHNASVCCHNPDVCMEVMDRPHNFPGLERDELFTCTTRNTPGLPGFAILNDCGFQGQFVFAVL